VAKKRKRAPGGGRKSNPNKKVMFSTRLEPEVMAALKAAAETWPGKNVSAFTEYLINRGLREREEEGRDPALRALLYLIGQLAEHVTGMIGFPGADRSDWRYSFFQFRAFKFAVHKLLDALEEPPDMGWSAKKVVEEQMKRGPRLAPGFFDREHRKKYLEEYKSPETRGASVLAYFYEAAQKTHALTERERTMMREIPGFRAIMEPRLYGIPQAWKDLQFPEGWKEFQLKQATKSKAKDTD